MTEEELVKEAKDSWWNDNNCSGALPTEKIYECGYIAGAEPREKRIAKLETSVSNLRKDNKELREVLPKLDKENDELKYKLTKAKEIMKHLLDWQYDEYKKSETDKELFKVIGEAEQFLNSEVEKCGQ